VKYEGAQIFFALPSSSAGVSLRHPRCSFPIRSRPVSVPFPPASTVSRAGMSLRFHLQSVSTTQHSWWGARCIIGVGSDAFSGTGYAQRLAAHRRTPAHSVPAAKSLWRFARNHLPLPDADRFVFPSLPPAFVRNRQSLIGLFGFIRPAGDGANLFFHISQITPLGSTPKVGSTVVFQIGENSRTGSP
jgi:cold shock CspA family protein